MGRISWIAVLAAAGLGACHVGEPSPDAFSRTGQLIALSGGEAGAGNACFICHGMDGEGLGGAPRLAGMSPGYLLKQLQDYADGRRADHIVIGRPVWAAPAPRSAVQEMKSACAFDARPSSSPAL